MVLLHIKRGDQNQFLYRTDLNESIDQLTQQLTAIYNGQLKIDRICAEIEELIKYGPMYPPEIIGLTEEQVIELKLKDEWEDRVYPSGGGQWQFNKDPVGRRNGRQPPDNLQIVLKNAIETVRTMVNRKLVKTNVELTFKVIKNALDILRGAITIVYPMQLPPHDNIRMELMNCEDLSGSQASLEVLESMRCDLWFAGRQMLGDKLLSHYLGHNDKCKIIIKLVKRGEGPPGREPSLDENAKRELMLQQYRRQEELKKLEQDDSDQYLNSPWADGNVLKAKLHGLGNLKYR